MTARKVAVWPYSAEFSSRRSGPAPRFGQQADGTGVPLLWDEVRLFSHSCGKVDEGRITDVIRDKDSPWAQVRPDGTVLLELPSVAVIGIMNGEVDRALGPRKLWQELPRGSQRKRPP